MKKKAIKRKRMVSEIGRFVVLVIGQGGAKNTVPIALSTVTGRETKNLGTDTSMTALQTMKEAN